MEYKDWKKIPLKEGEEDTLLTRMERWEEANQMKMNDLTEKEWIDVVSTLGAMTPWEAEELLNSLRSKQ